MCKFVGKIKQIIPFKGEIEKIDSFVGEFIKNYKPPVYDNELPIEWNTVEISNAGNKMYPYAPANRVKISSLVPTIEELEWMKIIRSSGGSEYELIFDSSVTNTEGYNVATFKNTAYNIAEYFTIVPKGENIPHGLYWYTNIFSSNDVTESGGNYKLYLPVAYDDEFPLEWNSLEVSKLANAKDGTMVKISNLTPTSEEMESIVLTIGNETFTFYKSIVTNQGMRYFYESGDNKFFVDVITNLVGAFPPTETGIYVEDVYYYYGTNVDYTASIVEQPDIPVEPSTPTQYLYGQVAEATVSYNGVVLPDIESAYEAFGVMNEVTVEEVKAVLPYAIIGCVEAGSEYRLFLCDKAPYGNAENGGMLPTDTNAALFTNDGNVWVYDGMHNFSFGGALGNALIWTSHDILNTDGSVYLAASDPVKSYPDADVIIDGVGYVGAVLPALPEWDRETYPYAYMWCIESFFGGKPTDYNVQFHSKPLRYGTIDGKQGIYVKSGVQYERHYCKTTEMTWKNMGETTVENAYTTEPVWTNHDVISDVDGSVFYVGTDPIPVYE